MRGDFKTAQRLKIRRQVHARVKARHLIAVAVEHQRRPPLCEQAVASPIRRSVAWLQRG